MHNQTGNYYKVIFIHNFLYQFVIAVTFVSLYTGCASKDMREIFIMPAPDVYDEETINPFADDRPIEIPYGGMLYVTDRKPAGEEDEDSYYLSQRGRLIRMGVAKIQLGDSNLTWEEAKRISLLKNRSDKYPLRVDNVEEIGILDRSINDFVAKEVIPEKPHLPAKQFAELINKKLSKSKNKDVYIYVHGYKVTFENPILVATELWHFLGYDGVFVAYSWPSTPKTLAYLADIETARYSSRHLRILIEYLSEETDLEKIHIVGYSAGTRVVINALQQITLQQSCYKNKSAPKNKLGHVILAGSDFDREIIGMYMQDGLLDSMDTLTIYLSETDKALGMSKFLFNRRRLGQIFDDEQVTPLAAEFFRKNKKLTIIDVTGAEYADAGNGHAYFRKSPWVSSDLLMTLMYDLSPEERGIVVNEQNQMWSFPEDYIDRLRTKLLEYLPGLQK